MSERLCAVAIMAKESVVGMVKTRLVSPLSQEEAAELTSPIPVGPYPYGAAASPSSNRVFIVNYSAGDSAGTVSVIDTAIRAVVATLWVTAPSAVAVTPRMEVRSMSPTRAPTLCQSSALRRIG